MKSFKYLQDKKYNWLLLTSIYLWFQFLIIKIYIEDFGITYEESKKSITLITNDYELWFLLLYGCLLGPAIEEVVYRGVLVRKKVFKILGVILLTISLGLTVGFNHWYSYIFLLIQACLFLLPLRAFTNKHPFLILILLSSSIFAIRHFITFEAPVLEKILFFSYYLGAGFFYSWLTLNYSIVWAIIFHIALNSFVFLRDLPLKEGDKMEKVYKNGTIVHWKENSFFDNKQSYIMRRDSTFTIQNGFPIHVSQGLLVNQDSLKNHIPLKEMSKYDIKIISTEKITDSLYFFILRDIEVLKKLDH